MVRTLLLIAAAGFLVSVVTLSVAVALAGPQAFRHGYAFTLGDHGWRWSDHSQRRSDVDHDAGPEATRDFPWSGGSSLNVSVPAEIEYVQADGPAKVTATGPQGALDDLRVENGRIRYAGDGWHDGKLRLVVTAPAVNDFALDGAETLKISGYHQDKLSVTVSGYGDVHVAGETHDETMTISGAGHADLGGLKARTAHIEIDGSGDTRLAPTDAAEIDISGSGDATLLTSPPKLVSHISGSGQVHQPRS
jgi:hypothetical protein